MGLYRIYIDEVGSHDLKHTDNPNERFFSLTGVILESSQNMSVLQPEMQQIKRSFFQTDPDEIIVFHRKELVNQRAPFACLRDPVVRECFNKSLLTALRCWDYTVITVAMDKKAHRERYKVWQYHPYHYCLEIMLERYVLFLNHGEHRGDVLVESRGGNEDEKLKASYGYHYTHGTEYVPPSLWQGCLTSGELKVKPKSANIAGLQLADLIAHPSRREILLEHGLLQSDVSVFGDQVSEILRQNKYYRKGPTGEIEGYGKKLLP